MYAVSSEECTGCGICLDSCPTGAIEMRGGVAQIDKSLCTSCGICGDECPMGAIYAYEEVPALYKDPREVAPLQASKSQVDVSQKSSVQVRRVKAPVLTRREKAVAAATLLPTLSRFFIRLAGRLSSRGGSRGQSSSTLQQRQPAAKTGQGRHRWRGGF